VEREGGARLELLFYYCHGDGKGNSEHSKDLLRKVAIFREGITQS
jgi:hypothetical protein